MSRLAIHIGFDKTGTTSIQRFLFERRQPLRERGFLYTTPARPTYPFTAYNHEPMTALFASKGLVPPATVRAYGSVELARGMVRQWSDSVRNKIRDPEMTLVISSEAFYFMPPPATKGLRGLLAWIANAENFEHGARIIAYLAEPVSRYRRASSQSLVMGRRIPRPRDQKARHFMQNYADVFGRERLTLRVYDRARLVNGDVVDDFLDFLSPGLAAEPAFTARGVEDNRSPSAEALLLLHSVRTRGFPASTLWEKIASEVLLFDRAVPGGRTAALTDAVSEHLESSSPDYTWLQGEFGIVFGGPLVRRAAGQFAEGRKLSIPDIFTVDRERYRELVSKSVRWSIHLPKSLSLEAELVADELIGSSCIVE